MEGLFYFAESIVNSAQPNLDGGLLAFILTNFVRIPPSTTDIPKVGLANSSYIAVEPQPVSFGAHFSQTISAGGYSAAVAIGVICIVVLLISIALICFLPNSNPSDSHEARYVPGQQKSPANCSPNTNSNAFDSIVGRARHCFVYMLLLAVAISCVLGMVTTVRLHINLSTPARYNATVGLLNPSEFGLTLADSNHVFPNIMYAVSNVRAYVNEFIPRTRAATDVVVDMLIYATEVMQNKTSLRLNDLLFDKIHVKSTFELGQKLGNHTIFLIEAIGRLEQLKVSLNDLSQVLGERVERWSDSIKETSRMFDNVTSQTTCPLECQLLSKRLGGLYAQKTQLDMPFAVAFTFLTHDQTAESVRAGLDRGRQVSDAQMAKTELRMRNELDIPGSIRRLIDTQWIALEPTLRDAVKAIDKSAGKIVEHVQPVARKVSTLLVAFSILFWLLMFGQLCVLCWLAYSDCDCRGKPCPSLRLTSLCCLCLLLATLIISTMLFLGGGYASTEVCRYLSPEKSTIVVKSNQSQSGTMKKLALDVHIDSFLTANWAGIKQLVAEKQKETAEPMPLPRLKSPIHAIAEACRDDVGILEAFDAIRDFDMSTMNKPEFSNRFISIGRNIMLDSLRNLNATEMFPPEVENQIAMADQLDRFLVNFNQTKKKLPRAFFLVRQNKVNSSEFIKIPISTENMVSSYRTLRAAYLEPRLPAVQMRKIDEYAAQVFDQEKVLTRVVAEMSKELDNLDNVKPISPSLVYLKGNMTLLKGLVNDRPRLIALASEMFNAEIAAKMPANSARLMQHFGPMIMGQVGQCRRLYDAYTAATQAICSGLVGHLNGLWLCVGLAFAFSCMSLGFVVTFFGQARDTGHSKPGINLQNSRA